MHSTDRQVSKVLFTDRQVSNAAFCMHAAAHQMVSQEKLTCALRLSLQEGSFAGMLRRVCGPLLHQSYELPAFLPGPDLAWLRMTPAQAQAHMARLLASINAANVALFGPLPDPPTKRVLLQNTVRYLPESCRA